MHKSKQMNLSKQNLHLSFLQNKNSNSRDLNLLMQKLITKEIEYQFLKPYYFSLKEYYNIIK